MNLSPKAEEILKHGMAKLRVKRSGIYQQITFRIRNAKFGNIEYVELFTERIIELTELASIADEIGLPVEAPNGRAFPKGKGAADYQTNQTATS